MKITIDNDDELYNIQFWSRKFKESLRELQSEGAPIDKEPVLVQAQIDSMTSVIQEMDQEIARYEEQQRDRDRTDTQAE